MGSTNSPSRLKSICSLSAQCSAHLVAIPVLWCTTSYPDLQVVKSTPRPYVHRFIVGAPTHRRGRLHRVKQHRPVLPTSAPLNCCAESSPAASSPLEDRLSARSDAEAQYTRRPRAQPIPPTLPSELHSSAEASYEASLSLQKFSDTLPPRRTLGGRDVAPLA